ncbi:MAG: zinc ribbon domain-containing protein [Acholeplasmatales bacterium]|nr:zinc ribbon domain-containing protein [Acholeplasmatales bacterium]
MKKSIVDSYFEGDRKRTLAEFWVLSVVLAFFCIVLLLNKLFIEALMLFGVTLISILFDIYTTVTWSKLREDSDANVKAIQDKAQGIEEIEVYEDDVRCSFCGNIITKDAKVCPYCKARIYKK